MFKFFLIAALVPVMVLANVNFRSCPNKAPAPKTLRVNNCSGDDCILVARKPLYAVASGVVSRYNSKTARTNVVARLFGSDLGYKWPAELSNACKGSLIGGCPVVAGKTYGLVLRIEDLDIPSLIIPSVKIPVEVEVSVTGDKGIVLGCARFDARISKR